MSHELTGYRVLVVEDEFFLATEIDDALTAAGAEVIGPLANFQAAMRQVKSDGFDLAVLDVNLGGDLAFPIADALVDQGVPFLFASAYNPSGVPVRHRDRPLLEKPYASKMLVSALIRLATPTS